MLFNSKNILFEKISKKSEIFQKPKEIISQIIISLQMKIFFLGIYFNTEGLNDDDQVKVLLDSAV